MASADVQARLEQVAAREGVKVQLPDMPLLAVEAGCGVLGCHSPVGGKHLRVPRRLEACAPRQGVADLFERHGHLFQLWTGVVGDTHASGPSRALRKRDLLNCSWGLVSWISL